MAERERENAGEDSIKVVCRFRPLNDSEEKAGSKFICKFPSGQEENCISIGVSIKFNDSEISFIIIVQCRLDQLISKH